MTTALALAACGNDLGDGSGDPAGPDAGTSSTTTSATGLPCDVQAILADHCQACHGRTLIAGAPIHLVTHADLVARNAAGVIAAQRCLDRMRNTSAKMPPPPATSVTAAEVAAFQSWVAAGAPTGECTPSGGGSGSGDDPFGGPVVCTSGTKWTGGNRESSLMHPGLPCIACHAAGEGPRFRVAGTVYPTGHEPDDCNGATGASVQVTDATGAVATLPVNAAGNFFSSTAFVSPIHVAVVVGGKRRAMSGSPPTGDCNSCHTQDGANLAPGRIALP